MTAKEGYKIPDSLLLQRRLVSFPRLMVSNGYRNNVRSQPPSCVVLSAWELERGLGISVVSAGVGDLYAWPFRLCGVDHPLFTRRLSLSAVI